MSFCLWEFDATFIKKKRFVDKFKEISLMLDFEELSPDVERVSNIVNFELVLMSVSYVGFSFLLSSLSFFGGTHSK